MKCNICLETKFMDSNGRASSKCVRCGSKERSRIMWLFIEKFTNLKKESRVLHVAPEKGIANRILKTVERKNYISCDIDPARFNKVGNIIKIDLCNDLENMHGNQFDLILHSHVIEHLSCSYVYVLFHLHRLLKKEGKMICSIPITEGYFDSCTSPELTHSQREERFSQFDHITRFGKADIHTHLGKVYNLPKNYDLTNDFSEETLLNFNIPKYSWDLYSLHSVLVLSKNSYLLESYPLEKGEAASIIDQQENKIDCLEKFIHDQKNIIHDQKNIINDKDKKIKRILNSKSWKITAPLRKGKKRLPSKRVPAIFLDLPRAFSFFLFQCCLRDGDRFIFVRNNLVNKIEYLNVVVIHIECAIDSMFSKDRPCFLSRFSRHCRWKVLRFFDQFRRIRKGEELLANKNFKKINKLIHDKKFDLALHHCNTFLEGFHNHHSSNVKFIFSLIQDITDLKSYQSKIASIHQLQKENMRPKVVVFSCIAGNYEPINLPRFINTNFEYVLFTDSPNYNTGVWQLKPILYLDADKTRTARYVKTHPHIFLKEFDLAIWIDHNITILGDIYEMIDGFVKSELPIAAIPHPQRKNVYEECDACIFKKKDSREVIDEQKLKYLRLRFSHNDLIESNFMMFDLRKEKTAIFLNAWWKEINSESKRDQLSINYAIASSQINWHNLTDYPNSIRNHQKFSIVGHDFDTGNDLKKELLEKLNIEVTDPYDGVSYLEIKQDRIKIQGKKKVDIIICVHNALADVQRCLNSVVKTRKSPYHNLIVIDDGSDKDTRNYLENFSREVSWCKFYRNERSLGYIKSANIGLRLSTGEFVILLNSDTVVTKDWIEKLSDAVFSSTDIGLVSPVSNAASYQSIPEIKRDKNQTAINKLPQGLQPDDINRFCEKWTRAHILPRVPLLHGFCFGIKREVIKKIGYFDEKKYPRGYGEEDDYCFRATDAGFGLVVATHTYIFHAKTKSYTKEERTLLARSAQAQFRKTYGEKRIERANETMKNNPILVKIRSKALKKITNMNKPFVSTPKKFQGVALRNEAHFATK